MSIWIIERKLSTETDFGWKPLPGLAFRFLDNAEEYVLRQRLSRRWQYRVVEYCRRLS